MQAVAYDILADAMLRMDAAGLDIIGTVHDEVIALAPCEKASPRCKKCWPSWPSHRLGQAICRSRPRAITATAT